MITKAFQAGQTFKTLDDKIATITRRTEKSVWYSIEGAETRRKIQVVGTEEMIHESKNFDVWADHCKAPKTEVKEPNTTESSATEVIETVEINPLSEAEYESIRESLVTRFHKINDWLATEKRERYFYVKDGGTDTESYDVAIADYRAKLKDLDNQIKELDAAQGLEPDPLD